MNPYKAIRTDAVKHRGRYIVPTSNETLWIYTWDEFKAAGGLIAFNEDQTEIELSLPPPYKFACSFNREPFGRWRA